MTVPSTARRAGPFLGNGLTTSFSFSFKTFAAADLQVVKTSSTGLDSVLVLASDYTVALNPDQDALPGGTVTYPVSGTPLNLGEKLTIIGDLDYEQTTDLLGGGAFNARVIEDTFDRATIQIQQLDERLDRALVLSAASAADPTLPVPSPTYLLAWNAAGTALQNVNPADLMSIAASSGFIVQVFSGTGTTFSYTLSSNPGTIGALEVYIAGVRQMPTTDYTLSGTTLTFTSAPPAGASNILARWSQALPVGILADGSVTPAKLSQPYTLGTIETAVATRTWTVPSWAQRIRIHLYAVTTTNASSNLLVQLGDLSAGIKTTNYSSASSKAKAAGNTVVNSTTGFIVAKGESDAISGVIDIVKIGEPGSNTHYYTATHLASLGSTAVVTGGGSNFVSPGGLSQVRLSSTGNDFNGGQINISYW